MRITGGFKRGLRLISLPGKKIRPTADRVKETIFNVLGQDLSDCVVVDAFAGTGAWGLEAYSRGARFVYFIENSPTALSVLQENLLKTRIPEHQYLLITVDLLRSPIQLSERAHLFYFDPPYQIWNEEVVLHLKHWAIANSLPDWLIIFEHSCGQPFFSNLADDGCEIRQIKIGNSQLTILSTRNE